MASRIQESMKVENFNSFLQFLESVYFRIQDHSKVTLKTFTQEICDLVFGQPHEMPLEGITKAIEPNLKPKTPFWFGYKVTEPLPHAKDERERAKRGGIKGPPEGVWDAV